MTDRDLPKTSKSIQNSLASRETVAPSGLSDSVPMGTGAFSQLPAPFGRFRVLKLLGHGAMGTVYLAFDSDLEKDVALKIPKADLNQDVVLWERFQREARAVGDLNHPNICGMYEVGQVGNTHYIEMEYVNGRSLSDYISGSQSQRRVVGVICKLAVGLAHAHERGIVHRDLKPANVMIDSTGEPKLMDFGLARRLDMPQDVRATQSGMIVGSPAYMSPEQARAEHDKIGPTTDIYGLGVLFYEMLTGSLPFRGQMVVVLGQIATQLPPRLSTVRPDVDPQLESLCLKMLAKKQRDRPQSMNEVVQTLVDWLKSENASPNASPSEPGMMAIAIDRSLVPLKPASAKDEKADPVETHKQRVNDLLAKHQYRDAIELLEKIVNLRDARFEKLVAWGRDSLSEVRATEQKMQEASAPLCATADKLLKRCDYAEAVKILSSVPLQYRSSKLRDLLQRSTELRDECDHLQRDVEEAIRNGDAESLPALIRRLCKLKPNSKAVQQLATDLKEFGAAKVIARRKSQRHTLESPGPIIERWQIAGSVALVIGIFISVSLLVRNYLANSQPSQPMTSPDETARPHPSLPTSITTTDTRSPNMPLPAEEPTRILAQPAPPATELPPTDIPEADEKAIAEMILQNGGDLLVERDGGVLSPLLTVDQIDDQPFAIRKVEFRLSDVEDSQIASLRNLKGLTDLSIIGCNRLTSTADTILNQLHGVTISAHANTAIVARPQGPATTSPPVFASRLLSATYTQVVCISPSGAFAAVPNGSIVTLIGSSQPFSQPTHGNCLFNPTETQLASFDGELKVHDVATGRLIAARDFQRANVETWRWSADSKTLHVLSSRHKVVHFDATDNTFTTQNLKYDDPFPGPSCFTDAGTLITSSSRGVGEGKMASLIAKWDCRDGRRLSSQRFDDSVRIVDVTATHYVTCKTSGVNRYSIKTLSLVNHTTSTVEAQWTGNSLRIAAAALNGRWIAFVDDSFSADGDNIYVYDTNSTKVVSHLHSFFSCCFSADGRFLALVGRRSKGGGWRNFMVVSIEIREAPFDDKAARWRLSRKSWRFERANTEVEGDLGELGIAKITQVSFQPGNRKLLLVGCGSDEDSSIENALQKREVGVFKVATPGVMWDK